MKPKEESTLRVLLTGATGFVGSAVYPALCAAGFSVTRTSRDPAAAARQFGGTNWVRFDANDPESTMAAFTGIDVVVFLVHAMASGPNYANAERVSAHNVRSAAASAGVTRVLYLGGVEPQAVPSKHLASRLETGRILREGTVPAWELRAGMIVGAGSESWRICRDLAMRLPLMVLPRWMNSKSQPVAIDDVVLALTRAVDLDEKGHQLFDIPGPETLSAKDILFRVAKRRGMRPLAIPVPLLSPALSSHWLRLVTGADFSVARELVEGLSGHLLASQPNLFSRLSHAPMSFDDAVTGALLDDKPGARARAVEWVARRVAARSHAPG